MKKILWFLIIIGLITSTISAQNWKPVTASVSFKIKHFGLTVKGNFKGFIGIIKFDPEDLINSSLFASVDANTLDTDNGLRNSHLKEKEEYFDVAKYPTLKMKTTKIVEEGENFLGYFDLTIKGKTKNIKIPIMFTPEGEKATFQGSTIINRRDWSVGKKSLGMSNDVVFTIVVNTIKI
jgi:polyisoprenoid-binding protein YceI